MSLDRAINQIVGQIHNPEPGSVGPDRVFTDDGEYDVTYCNDSMYATIDFGYATVVVRTLRAPGRSVESLLEGVKA